MSFFEFFSQTSTIAKSTLAKMEVRAWTKSTLFNASASRAGKELFAA